MKPCLFDGVMSYDIAMIRAFILVYETRSVGITAANLHVSQPAVSYNLSKLRRHFDDPLFHRRNGQMLPTAVADQIYPELVDALARMDSVLAAPHAFDAQTSTRTFTLTTTDVGMLGLVPRLLRALTAAAPRAALHVRPLDLPEAADDLATLRTDAVICTPSIGGEEITRDLLFRQPYVGVCAPHHPRIGDRPTMEEYLAERHIAITSETGHTVVSERLADLDAQIDVAITVPNFTALPGIIADSELLGFAPRITAARLHASGVARAFEFPFEVPQTEVSLFMLRRTAGTPANAWFRSLVLDTLRHLDSDYEYSAVDDS